MTTCKEKLISVLVPMYNEADVIRIFLHRIIPILDSIGYSYEIVCVNDGSRDQTLELLVAAHLADPRIKVIDLSRNFGKEVALTAALDFAQGDAVIPIDADLQDPPELIPVMVEKWQSGYEMVVAVRSERRSDTFGKRFTAAFFYKVMANVADTPIPMNAGDFRLMDRKVVEALRQLPERTRFMKGLFSWVGFKTAHIRYKRDPRAAGKTKWRYWDLWNLALEGLFSFTTLPLRIWTYLGAFLSIFSMFYVIYVVFRTLILGSDVPGYASIIVAILFFSGINLVGLGILGEYLGRIFIEVKRRPLYVVRDTLGVQEFGMRKADTCEPSRVNRL